MGAIGRVQARGQVTLPREIRAATGIEAETIVAAIEEGMAAEAAARSRDRGATSA